MKQRVSQLTGSVRRIRTICGADSPHRSCQLTDRICEENPDHLWCKLWLKDRSGGSQAPGQVPSSSASVSTRQQVVDQTEESHANVESGAEATGDQFGDAADETSEVLPPGMSPTEKDLKDG